MQRMHTYYYGVDLAKQIRNARPPASATEESIAQQIVVAVTQCCVKPSTAQHALFVCEQ